ncbi:MAG: COG4315 family predicted lipoprotein [Rhodospirillaceae bacterium]
MSGRFCAILMCGTFCASPAAQAASKAVPLIEHQPVPIEVGLHKEGKTYWYQNNRGKRFYTYDKDEPGKSNCVEKCIEVWAPLLSRIGAKPLGEWTLLPREFERTQWVYKGRPVYFNVAENFLDGDANLQNDGHWHVLTPQAPSKP